MFAGVNSSLADLAQGKNEHFRMFGIDSPAQPKGKAKSGTAGAAVDESVKLSELSRSSLFSVADKDSYQRLLRLSKPYPGQPQLGAVATGFAKEPEIVLFETAAVGSRPTVKGAIKTGKEVQDMDFIQTGPNDYVFAYCDEHDVYTKKISSQIDSDEPECVYITPASRNSESGTTIPKFRALKWLTKDFLCMLTNIHSTGGVVLQILRLPREGDGQCRIAQSHRLPSSITKATGLAVSNLTPPETPSSSQDYSQFVIAVAGHNISISLFKVDLQHAANAYLITPVKPLKTFRNVHPLQITSISFSLFTPPALPVKASTPPQYLKLASTGMSNTVVVHTIPLFLVPLEIQRGHSRTPRYVVALPSTAILQGASVIGISILVILIAVLVQSVLEIRGGVPSYLGARDHVPILLQEAIGRPYQFPADYSALRSADPIGHHSSKPLHPVEDPVQSEPSSELFAKSSPEATLTPFLQEIKQKADAGVAIIIQETVTPHETNPELEGAKAYKADLHQGETGQKWDELSHEQKVLWQERLTEAGHWKDNLPMVVAKGVVFGQLAGVVGQAVAGAI